MLTEKKQAIWRLRWPQVVFKAQRRTCRRQASSLLTSSRITCRACESTRSQRGEHLCADLANGPVPPPLSKSGPRSSTNQRQRLARDTQCGNQQKRPPSDSCATGSPQLEFGAQLGIEKRFPVETAAAPNGKRLAHKRHLLHDCAYAVVISFRDPADRNLYMSPGVSAIRAITSRTAPARVCRESFP